MNIIKKITDSFKNKSVQQEQTQASSKQKTVSHKEQDIPEEVNQEKDETHTSDSPKEQKESETSHSGTNKIYNLLIVDESGSMTPLRKSTLSGINEVIGTIRQAQNEFRDTQQHYLSLVTFDSPGRDNQHVRTIIDKTPIDEVKDFTEYMPNGCTPLYDAMGISLTDLKNHIGNDISSSVVVTVLTDGLENASMLWNADKLKTLIEQLKEMGWSFSYMGSAHNVKEVTDLLSIENVVEFSHDQLGASDTWERERSSRRAYYSKMNSCDFGNMEQEEILRRKKALAHEYYSERTTPDNITELEPDQIFVFGSNIDGSHAGGAAAFACLKFGAVRGQGEGLQGQSYALPTVKGIDVMREAVHRFTIFAAENPDKQFLVTRVGCGTAGYSPRSVAPLFRDCIRLENVFLPEDFWDCLGLKMSKF